MLSRSRLHKPCLIMLQLVGQALEGPAQAPSMGTRSRAVKAMMALRSKDQRQKMSRAARWTRQVLMMIWPAAFGMRLQLTGGDQVGSL